MSATESDSPKKPISVYDVLAVFIEELASIAWVKLGLQHDPIAGTMGTDLVEAKTAIDSVAGLVSQLESQLDEEDKRRLHSLLRDLRINYVNKSQGN